MAKNTLLTERQVSSFMKLANIREDRIKNFLGSGKKSLREEFGGPEMEEEPVEDEAPEEGGEEMAPEGGEGAEFDSVDMEPEAPGAEDLEATGDEFKTYLADVLAELLPDAIAQAMGGEASTAGVEGEEGMEDMELSSDEMSDDEGPVEDEEEEEVVEEEPELQESRFKKAVARNLKGGDKRNIKESVAFKNVDLITDDEVINEVLRRVIRRLV